MNRFSVILATALAGSGFVFGAEDGITIDEKHRGFLEKHCVECHNADKTKGKVRLDEEGFPFQIDSIPSADLWQDILAALNAQEMPPEEETQPTSEEKAEFLGMLSGKLVEARSYLSDSGGQIIMRRLNQLEYQNTLESLLGVPVNVSKLPTDRSSGVFDTNGSALFLSSDQIEQYLTVARVAVKEALRPPNPYGHIHQRFEAEEVTNEFIEKNHRILAEREAAANQFEADESENPDPKKYGLLDLRDVEIAHNFYDRFFGSHDAYLKHPLSKSGALLCLYKPIPHCRFSLSKVKVKVPLPPKSDGKPRFNETFRPYPTGTYKVKARVGLTPEAVKSGEAAFFEFGVDRKEGGYLKKNLFEVTQPAEQPQIIETEVYVSPEIQRLVFIEEGDEARKRFHYAERHRKTNDGGGHEIWIDWVEIDGPIEEVKPEPLQRIFDTLTVDSNREEVLELLNDFGTLAYRGEAPTPDLLEKLYQIYQNEMALEKEPLEAIVEPMAVLLSTPTFLYLNEPAEIDEEKTITQRELAVRMAYLFTSAPPDEKLLDLARRRQIQGDQLDKQVDRLLSSPESDRFYRSFLYQWLNMERLFFFQFPVNKFPNFSPTVQEAAAEEIYETFQTILEEDLSTANLLKSDFVVINSLMAAHYGIEGVQGNHYRKVMLPEGSVRGGLTGMAAIHAMGSDGIHSSPVERGAWVLRKILHDPPPPAPANVPMLSRLTAKELTKGELLKVHQEEAQCAHCHKKIDPIGLGLENFDPTGIWRTSKMLGKFEYEIDPSGKVHRGPEFQDYEGLRNYFADQVDNFNRGLIENLVSYSLGRKVGFTDQEWIDALHEEMKSNGNRLRPVLHSIVAAEAFQTKK